MTHSINEIITALVAGGVIQAVFQFILNKRKYEKNAERIDFEVLLKTLKEQLEITQQQKEELQVRVFDLERIVSKLEAKITILESQKQ